jgi:hypothetical protein
VFLLGFQNFPGNQHGTVAIHDTDDQYDETITQTRRNHGNGQLLPLPTVRYPRQPQRPTKCNIEFGALFSGFNISLSAGVAQPFAQRLYYQPEPV